MLTICYYISASLLYGFSIFISFLFTGFLIKPLTLKELEDDKEENRKFETRLQEENYEYNYLDEYEKLDEKELDQLKLDDLKNKETILEIPFLKTTIIMFYEDSVFKYYSNTEVMYKYLNVVCRKFVIEHDSKKLYIDGIMEEVVNQSVKSDLFVTKAETKMLERKFNHFIRIGSIHDYNNKNNIKLIKEIDILDFLNLNLHSNNSNDKS
jgi:hypothetical protein